MEDAIKIIKIIRSIEIDRQKLSNTRNSMK